MAGAARRQRRGGDREHRHRRPDADPRGGQEPRLRGGGGLARELRRRARGAARRRRARSPTRTREALATEAFSYTARYDAAISRWFAEREEDFPAQYTRVVREGARPLLRREPAPARRLLRADRRAHATCCRWSRSSTARSCRSTTCSTSTRAASWSRSSRCRPRRSSSTTTRAACAVGGQRRARRSTRRWPPIRMSAFGGVMCFNRRVDRALAEKLNAMFVELVFAPGYDEDALEMLSRRRTSASSRTTSAATPTITEHDIKRVRGGLLVQDRDAGPRDARGDAGGHRAQAERGASGASCCSRGRSCKHVRSNAIVLAQGPGHGGRRRRADEPRRLGADRGREGRRSRASPGGRGDGLRRLLPVRRRPAGRRSTRA